MLKTRNVFIIFIACLYCGIVSATEDCAIAEQAIASPAELIARSSRIVLATPVELTDKTIDPTRNEKTAITIDIDRELDKILEDSPQKTDRITPRIHLARLKVLETLHGTATDYVHIAVRGTPQTRHETDFDAHTAAQFWNDNRMGRSAMDANCVPIVSFTPENTYLVIEGPFHVKAYELIRREDDQWLAYVREHLE